MKKIFLVLLSLSLVLFILTACDKNEEQNIVETQKVDLSDYSETFKTKYEKYIGYDKTISDVSDMVKLILTENKNNIDKIYVELKTEDGIVIKSTIEENYIKSIPEMIEGATSFDIIPSKDNVGDTVITIVSKFE